MRTFRTTTKRLPSACRRARDAVRRHPAGHRSQEAAEPVRSGSVPPNVTHVPAIVGVESGIYKKKLGSNVTLDLHTFNSGTEALQAFQAEELDASYIGPSPTISVWTS